MLTIVKLTLTLKSQGPNTQYQPTSKKSTYKKLQPAISHLFYTDRLVLYPSLEMFLTKTNLEPNAMPYTNGLLKCIASFRTAIEARDRIPSPNGWDIVLAINNSTFPCFEKVNDKN